MTKKSAIMLAIISMLAVCSPPVSPAQQGWEFMRGWNDEKRITFTQSCVDALGKDYNISQTYSNQQLTESCSCVTAYYESKYDYDTFRQMMDTETFNATPAYREEMYHISYQCAKWVFGKETL